VSGPWTLDRHPLDGVQWHQAPSGEIPWSGGAKGVFPVGEMTGEAITATAETSSGDEPRRFVELTRAECFHLLSSRGVGRLALSFAADAPLVVPVNFVVDEGSVFFRTGHGTKLRTLAARPVSFQVDDFDHLQRTGWSVLARGRAHEISRREVTHLELEPWIPEQWLHWVRLEVRSISGRRLERLGEWAFDRRAYL
jgi:uncharacterized protein